MRLIEPWRLTVRGMYWLRPTAMHPHIFLLPLSIPANCPFFHCLQANFALQEHCLHKIRATMLHERNCPLKKRAYPAIFFEQFPTQMALSMGNNSQGRQAGWWVVRVVHWSEAETLDG